MKKICQKICILIVFSPVMLGLQACTHLMFAPMKELVRTPEQVGVEYKDIVIKSGNDTLLHGWHLPAVVDVKGSIVFFHGNGENISTHLATVYWLPEQGYEVFLVDYRGYGLSKGDVDLAGSIADVDAAIQYALDNKNSDKGLVVLGHSFGGSLGLYSVAVSDIKDDIAAVISIGAFSDYRQIVKDVLSRSWVTWIFQWPLSYTINNEYAPVDYVHRISPVPLLLMHSGDDEVVPYYHSESLFSLAQQPKYLERLTGDHNHTFQYEENRVILLDYLTNFVN